MMAGQENERDYQNDHDHPINNYEVLQDNDSTNHNYVHQDGLQR